MQYSFDWKQGKCVFSDITKALENVGTLELLVSEVSLGYSDRDCDSWSAGCLKWRLFFILPALFINSLLQYLQVFRKLEKMFGLFYTLSQNC